MPRTPPPSRADDVGSLLRTAAHASEVATMTIPVPHAPQVDAEEPCASPRLVVVLAAAMRGR